MVNVTKMEMILKIELSIKEKKFSQNSINVKITESCHCILFPFMLIKL